MRVLVAAAIALCACSPEATPPAQSRAPSTPAGVVTPSPAGLGISGRSIPFERVGIRLGKPSGRTTGSPTALVASSQEEFANLFSNERLPTHVSDAPPLPVDTGYIAAFAGTRPSSGYDIQVVDVRATRAGLAVWVTQTVPGSGALGIINYPVDTIRLGASELRPGMTVELRDTDSRALLARVAYCGSSRKVTPLTPYDPSARDCVWSAYSRGETAQWLSRTLTTEGGPIIRTLRAVPGGLSEVSLDDRGDGFAHRPGVRSYACPQIARSTAYSDTGGTVVWFSLSACIGDGAEVDVG